MNQLYDHWYQERSKRSELWEYSVRLFCSNLVRSISTVTAHFWPVTSFNHVFSYSCHSGRNIHILDVEKRPMKNVFRKTMTVLGMEVVSHLRRSSKAWLSRRKDRNMWIYIYLSSAIRTEKFYPPSHRKVDQSTTLLVFDTVAFDYLLGKFEVWGSLLPEIYSLWKHCKSSSCLSGVQKGSYQKKFHRVRRSSSVSRYLILA